MSNKSVLISIDGGEPLQCLKAIIRPNLSGTLGELEIQRADNNMHETHRVVLPARQKALRDGSLILFKSVKSACVAPTFSESIELVLQRLLDGEPRKGQKVVGLLSEAEIKGGRRGD